MIKQQFNLNPEVTTFLDKLNHPFRQEIEAVRNVILNAQPGLSENIKWNGPNYSIGNQDRITMNIQPPKKQVLIIFHCGAKTREQPKERLVQDPSSILTWKGNDRCIATFRSMDDISEKKNALTNIVQEWITATSEK